MEPTLYVRVEGVNLDNFVSDVHDLSTIRGGSFLLLDAVNRVQDEFKLQAISTGASSGLFAAADDDPAWLRKRIEDFLHEDWQLRHATFVVDVCRGEFAAARESLAAMNRWRQFQQPTVAVPSAPSRPTYQECALDHVRPAVDFFRDAEGKERQVSASVKARRDFGGKEKRAFYARELSHLELDAAEIQRVADAEFVLDLETLAREKEAGTLNDKIAVIHFDGNKFGTIQRRCDTRESLERFDRTIKAYRRNALARLLRWIFDQPGGWWTADRQIRMETLLWGGDELTWVVPAWKGWEVLGLFYDVSASWVFGETPLTHAGGIIFCHRSAPIHRMTALAKKLAESCKSGSMPASHQVGDRFAYEVLESFDEVGPDVEKFRAGRLPGGDASDLVLDAAGLDAVAPDFDTVRRRFPRSKLHAIVVELREGRDAMPLISSTVGEIGDAERAALRRLFGFFVREETTEPDAWLRNRIAWLHLAELWDYAIAGWGTRP